MRARFVPALAAALLLAAPLSPPVHGQPPVGQAGFGGAQLAAFEATAGAGSDPTSSSRIDSAVHQVESLRTQQQRADAEIGVLRSQYAAARGRLRLRVRTLQRLRRAGALPLSSGFDAMLRHQSRVTRLERIVSRDARAFRTIGRRVEVLREEAVRLGEAVTAGEQRVETLRREQASERSQLELLSRMIEDPAGWSGAGAGYGIRLSGSTASAERLSDHQGSLPLPVGGSAQIRDAEREGGEGLEFTAHAGVTARSVGAGTVSYAAPHPAYGQLVIVDHGDGHYTVYGGLGAISVRAGAQVRRDSVLGAVGPQPLFFQVRRGTRPLPARRWLGI